MAAEAQRLIGISLSKIAQSRMERGGISLHKNLLVATVLQKARIIFMEEAYHMVHGHYPHEQAAAAAAAISAAAAQMRNRYFCEQQEALCRSYKEQHQLIIRRDGEMMERDDDADEEHEDDDEDAEEDTERTCATEEDDGTPNDDVDDKENEAPIELTYYDLDNHIKIRDNPKRRRDIAEWETEEAVLSILPKKVCRSEEKNVDLSTSCTTPEAESTSTPSFLDDDEGEQSAVGEPMEISRITSLVSIFSFGSLTRQSPVVSPATADLHTFCTKNATNTSSVAMTA
ncbi:immediate early response gene 5-like protein [Lutzomyia longipalpis]|uniref:immediate early response gene 5-like protein n=1 Tax=Lutzomyia longipalpis TaxID=7200 RepID=UPI0024840C72|nr:immediate early response gene 5-like protein [Lutzomyia longipalpis]